MLIRACVSQKLGCDLIIKVIEGRKTSLSTTTMLLYVEMLKSYGLKQQALKVIQEIYAAEPNNIAVQASLLSQMVAVDLNQAYRLQQNLPQPSFAELNNMS